MKRSGNFFIWIVMLAAGLLITITIAQVITQQSISRLRQGNKQASTTFTMNNRMQEMVNLAFELESKILSGKPAELISPKRGIKDSLTRLEYNIGVLEKIWSDTVQVKAFSKLVQLIDNQVDVSFGILNATEKNNLVLQKVLTDSLRKSHWGDSIYSAAISFQKGLEQNLSATLEQNNKSASQLSLLNRLLASVALLAILVLATIIIRRQVKQLSLIKDLQEARKVALQSVEAKDQFLANMSHEIRTPLNAIKGFGNILSQTTLSTEQQKYTSIISTASENLLNIVNDILDFSKIEAGNVLLKKKVFQLGQVVSEVELMFTPLAQEKELQLLFTIDKTIPGFVKGDPERLRQILVNLLSNAIKFTNAGSVSLSVQLIQGKDNRIRTRFSVTDTGVGIPAEKISIIFERFEQLDYSSTRQQGGTGLGLAITKKLVEAMDGKITVKSEIGKGSLFTVDIDFEKVNSTLAEQQQLMPVQNLETVSLQNIKILVAEDNKMNQLLVKSILDKYDVQTEIVDNGEEAIAAMQQNHFDIILMDVQMPKMDGISATKLFRNDKTATTPVIAMTAHVLPGEREKCMAAGMNDYLSKPLDEDELIAMIKRYFSLKKPALVLQTDTSTDNWLNLVYLNSICGNDQQKIVLILKEFEKQLQSDIGVLEKSRSTKDKIEIKRICHHLRSTLSPLKASAPPVLKLGELSELLSINKGGPLLIEAKMGELISALNATKLGLERILSPAE
jgi:signal transduction histidine kinase/DNA-binding response OmpR family regulator